MKTNKYAIAAPAAVVACLAMAHGPALASPVFGVLANFDVVNDTGKTAHGFEISLEGLSLADITDTFGGAGRGFPTTVERYGAPSVTSFNTGTSFGVNVTYMGVFSAGAWNVGTPSGVFATPGESCWTGGGIGYGPSTPCDHFGVGTRGNATKTTYSWLLETSPSSPTLTPSSSSIPAPTWAVTPQPAGPPIIVAQVQAPPPPEAGEPQFGTPIWVKVFTTEFDEPVALEDLLGNNPKVDEAENHTEIEWQLLQTDPGNPEAGKLENGGAGAAGANAESVLRRYEFYKYIGAVNPDDNEAQPVNGDSNPLPGEIGDFIGNQNAAINLNGNIGPLPVDVPEPSGLAVLAIGLAGFAAMVRRGKRLPFSPGLAAVK